MIIAIIIAVSLLGLHLGFTFGILSGNGVAVPPSANQSVALNYVNNQFNQQYNVSLNKTGQNLQVPQSNLGFIGAFFVFGGLILSVFGYVAAIPQALSSIFTVYQGTLSGASVAVGALDIIWILAGITLSVAGVLILFEIISGVQKYRT